MIRFKLRVIYCHTVPSVSIKSQIFKTPSVGISWKRNTGHTFASRSRCQANCEINLPNITLTGVKHPIAFGVEKSEPTPTWWSQCIHVTPNFIKRWGVNRKCCYQINDGGNDCVLHIGGNEYHLRHILHLHQVLLIRLSHSRVISYHWLSLPPYFRMKTASWVLRANALIIILLLNPDFSREQIQWFGHWSPSSFHLQGISSHGIEYAGDTW